MIEYENSKSDDQLEELLLLTEQMQEELDQKDRTLSLIHIWGNRIMAIFHFTVKIVGRSKGKSVRCV